MTEKQKPQTNEERATPQKPDGVLTKKMNGKTFVTEIYFDKKSNRELSQVKKQELDL